MNTKSHFTKIAHHQTLIHVIHIYEFESRSVEVYSIQHYVIKFVSDLWQVGGFDHHGITEILLKVALSTINPTHPINHLSFN
jgi:hypothetical protein